MSHRAEKDRIRQAFAGRLRQALRELGYEPTEQRRLQELFGVSGQAVRKWTEGASMPTAARMPYVASVLGVRRAWLQDGEEPIRPVVGVQDAGPPAEEKLRLDPQEVQLLIWYRSLPEKEQEALRRIIRSMAHTN